MYVKHSILGHFRGGFDEIPTPTCEPPEIASWKGLELRRSMKTHTWALLWKRDGEALSQTRTYRCFLRSSPRRFRGKSGSGIKDQGSRIADRGKRKAVKKQNWTETAQENPKFELHKVLAWSNAILLDECFLSVCDYATLPSLVFVK